MRLELAVVVGLDLGLDLLAQGGFVHIRLGGRTSGARGGTGTGLHLGLEVFNLCGKIVVFILELRKSVLHEVEEGIHLILVVAALANRRLAESDVMYICGCQRH